MPTNKEQVKENEAAHYEEALPQVSQKTKRIGLDLICGLILHPNLISFHWARTISSFYFN